MNTYAKLQERLKNCENNEDKFAAAVLGYGQLEKMMPFDWQNAKMH